MNRHRKYKIREKYIRIQKIRPAKAPLDFHDILLESAAPQVLEAIHKLTPDSFERLVKWYMEQSGASHTFIPAKNENGKENGADADVIAEFAPLGIVFFIQVIFNHDCTFFFSVIVTL